MWVGKVGREVRDQKLPENKGARGPHVQQFAEEIKRSEVVKKVREEVLQLCKRFPLYGELM